MRNKIIKLNIEIGISWIFSLLPAIILDWYCVKGYTTFRFLWFYIKFESNNTTIKSINKIRAIDDDNKIYFNDKKEKNN